MKKITIIIISILFVSCNRHYSLEYFQMYNPDAPNRMMAKSKDFVSVDHITYQKFSYDLFLVSLFYWNSRKELDSSYAQFNHNGKMLTFEN